MKKFILFFVLVAVAGGGFWMVQSGKSPFFSGQASSAGKAVYYCPMHPTYTSDRPGDCPICNMKLVKKEDQPSEADMAAHLGHSEKSVEPRVFTLAELLKMKPGEICLLHKCKMGTCMIAMTEEFARLGKCPHCGEDLGIIVKDFLPAGYTHVKLTDEKQQMIGIKTAPAKKITATKTIRTVGRIAYDPDLYQAEEEFVQAIQAFKKAEAGNIEEVKTQAAKLVDSSKLRLKLMGLGEDLIREIETAGKPDRSLLYGEGGGTVWLYAPIYEYEIPLVKTGQEVTVEVPAIPGKKFQGTIRAIDSVLDPMTRSIRVRAVLNNTEGFLKPEMYVNAVLQIALGEILVVPEEAVFSTGDKNIVFVSRTNGYFEPREVVVGTKTEDYYGIKSGVSEGDRVVTSGNFLIDSESRLKAALEGIGGGGGHKHGA